MALFKGKKNKATNLESDITVGVGNVGVKSKHKFDKTNSIEIYNNIGSDIVYQLKAINKNLKGLSSKILNHEERITALEKSKEV